VDALSVRHVALIESFALSPSLPPSLARSLPPSLPPSPFLFLQLSVPCPPVLLLSFAINRSHKLRSVGACPTLASSLVIRGRSRGREGGREVGHGGRGEGQSEKVVAREGLSLSRRCGLCSPPPCGAGLGGLAGEHVLRGA
jgi:hypothetical protein